MRRRIIYSLSFIILTSAFIWGFLTVYVNCYNSMNAEPITVFGISRSDDRITASVLGEDLIVLHIRPK